MSEDTKNVVISVDAQFRGRIEALGEFLKRVETALTKATDEISDLEPMVRNDSQLTLASLGIAMFSIKERYETLDKQLKVLYHFADGLNKSALPRRMMDLDVSGFRVPEIARSFSIVEKTSASFLDKEKGLKWLRSIGQGDMIQETVNAQTLSTFCRNMLLEEGRDPPAEIIKTSIYNTTSMTKYRPK